MDDLASTGDATRRSDMDKLKDGFAALKTAYLSLIEAPRSRDAELRRSEVQALWLLREKYNVYYIESFREKESDLLETCWDHIIPSDAKKHISITAIGQADALSMKAARSETDACKLLNERFRDAMADLDDHSKSKSSVHQNGEYARPTTPPIQRHNGCPFQTSDLLSNHEGSNGAPTASQPPQVRTGEASGLDVLVKGLACESNIPTDKAQVTSAVGVCSLDETSLCPLRSLDKAKPEDVASFLEHHKQEIPRSHEVCVKRYRSNADAIRRLDSQYGNSASMIEGLGLKHQRMLQDKHKVDPTIQNKTLVDSGAKTEIQTSKNESDTRPNEERSRRSDRPLREIRVGESPTRPWGIPVPFQQDANELGAPFNIEPAPVPLDSLRGAQREEYIKTPRSSYVPRNDGPDREPMKDAGNMNAKIDPEELGLPLNITINGPIFLGYPVDQVVKLVQEFNIRRAAPT